MWRSSSRNVKVTPMKKKRSEFSDSKSTARGTLASHGLKRAAAIFFRTAAGNEPVREWLKAMSPEDRLRIGEDIRTVEYGWPIGMPACRPLGNGLHEVRASLAGNRIARVFFISTPVSRWFCCTALSRKRRPRLQPIWNWRVRTRCATKEESNEEPGQETLRSQWLQLRELP